MIDDERVSPSPGASVEEVGGGEGGRRAEEGEG
jgi:hypothetical protein